MPVLGTKNAAPTDAGKSCVHNGKTYQNGKSFKVDCNTCTCNKGTVGCTRMACATDNHGRCPPSDPNAITICLVECGDDNGCPGNQLCCTNGCRASCTNPVGIGQPCQFALLNYVKKNHAIIKDKCTKKEKASKTTVIHVNVRMAMLPAHALHVHGEVICTKKVCGGSGGKPCISKAKHTKMEIASQLTAIRAHAEMEYHFDCPGLEKCCSTGCGRSFSIPDGSFAGCVVNGKKVQRRRRTTNRP
ncbi:hypothetical protein DPMN_075454 [Dreissena polymorpha]|uniref:WAP domain-containing protein n=1 Tax=Dreissena polymorpha TaxID=45954 RepID=A0A9D3YKE1_DREPO|nr:hypothetical protein DPMN_075454 [Dreissena polymorpha]